MKRTVEIVLTTIGLILAGFTTFIGYSFKTLTTNQVVYDEVLNRLYEMGYSDREIDTTVAFVVDLGQPLMIASILALIGGAVSIYLFMGNKNAKAAGIILLATAIIGSIYSQLALGFTALCFIIASIVAFVRKQSSHEETVTDYYTDL